MYVLTGQLIINAAANTYFLKKIQTKISIGLTIEYAKCAKTSLKYMCVCESL